MARYILPTVPDVVHPPIADDGKLFLIAYQIKYLQHTN